MREICCVLCSGKGYEVYGTGTEVGDIRRFCNVCNGSGIVYADFLYVRQAGYHSPVVGEQVLLDEETDIVKHNSI